MSTSIQFNRGVEEIYESDQIHYEAQVSNVKEAETLDSSISDSDIVVTKTSPKQAFEVFNGKLYYSTSANKSYYQYENSSFELPWDKLCRIQNELADLISQLDAKVQSIEDKESSLYSTLYDEAMTLSKLSNSTVNHPGFAVKSNQVNNASLANLNKIISEIKDASSVQVKNPHMNSNAQLTSDTSNSISSLESRIFILETFLGNDATNSSSFDISDFSSSLNSTKSASTSLPYLDMLSKVEGKLSLIDSSNLDTVKLKLSSVRLDLETINKSKNAITDDKVWNGVKKVDDIIAWIKSVESFNEDLPQLLMRLKTLENTHIAASNLSIRFNTAEQLVGEVSDSVQENSQLLIKLENSLSESLLSMENNIKVLEERMSNLAN